MLHVVHIMHMDFFKPISNPILHRFFHCFRKDDELRPDVRKVGELSFIFEISVHLVLTATATIYLENVLNYMYSNLEIVWANSDSQYIYILCFTFLFSLFVFVSAAGQYNVIWTGTGLHRFRFGSGTVSALLF